MEERDRFRATPQTEKSRPSGGGFLVVPGAGNRNRTYDLRITNAPLYQLSYSGRAANSRGDAAWRSIDQLQAQLFGQGEHHVLGLAGQLGDRAGTQLVETVDHPSHQHFRR